MGSLCALHGIWAFASRASVPIPGTEEHVQKWCRKHRCVWMCIKFPDPLSHSDQQEKKDWTGAQGSEAGPGLASKE